jgi:hypothetical protein
MQVEDTLQLKCYSMPVILTKEYKDKIAYFEDEIESGLTFEGSLEWTHEETLNSKTRFLFDEAMRILVIYLKNKYFVYIVDNDGPGKLHSLKLAKVSICDNPIKEARIHKSRLYLVDQQYSMVIFGLTFVAYFRSNQASKTLNRTRDT